MFDADPNPNHSYRCSLFGDRALRRRHDHALHQGRGQRREEAALRRHLREPARRLPGITFLIFSFNLNLNSNFNLF